MIYQSGAAYVFRNLDTATGTVTQNAKLTASDIESYARFGNSVSVSGSTGLVGAYGRTVGSNAAQGVAYVFRNLDTAIGTVTQNVKLTASDGASGDNFGRSVSLDSVGGDQFIIGAYEKNNFTGKSYSGSVASVTTLDSGNTMKVIDGISFVSKDDWVIGNLADGNQVTLKSGNSANVMGAGKEVYVGRTLTSDSNTLIIGGSLSTTDVFIGDVTAALRNTANVLQLESTATFSAISFKLAQQNLLKIAGDYSNSSALLAYLGSTQLQVWDGSAWVAVTSANSGSTISETYTGGYTNVSAVPEPSTYVFCGLGLLAVVLHRRNRRTS